MHDLQSTLAAMREEEMRKAREMHAEREERIRMETARANLETGYEIDFAEIEKLEYIPKTFEILDGEIREVLEDEARLVRENPGAFSHSVQRKYFGKAECEWEFPQGEDRPLGEGEEEYYIKRTNPYTGESRNIRCIRSYIDQIDTEYPVQKQEEEKEDGKSVLKALCSLVIDELKSSDFIDEIIESIREKDRRKTKRTSARYC